MTDWSSAAGARSRVTGRMIAGAILILLGVLFTLDNFGLIEAGDIFRYWPLFLVGVGVLKISQARAREQQVGGILITLIGLLFLARTLHFFSFRGRDLWPLLLLAGGALLVWQALRRRSGEAPAARAPGTAPEGLGGFAVQGGGSAASPAVLNEFAFMGGGDRSVRTREFRGGEVTAIMGGFDIDLRGTEMAGDSADVEIFVLWGGVVLRVPEDWTVVMRGTPILGGFSNTSRSGANSLPPAGTAAAPGAAGKTLVVHGTAIMGGVEVKN